MNDQERRQHAKHQLRSLLGLHGIAGVLEILAELCQDFGEGNMGGELIDADSFWLEAAAHVSNAADELKGLLRRTR